jgi:hypothetical protein
MGSAAFALAGHHPHHCVETSQSAECEAAQKALWSRDF